MSQFETVLYPTNNDEQGFLRVEELSATGAAATECMRVQVAAYSKQFENNPSYPHRLPIGATAGHFNVYDSDVVRQRRQRMQQFIDAGHTYVGARVTDDEGNVQGEDSLAGFIKFGPSRGWLQKLGVLSPNMFIGDLAVIPDRQNNAIGSTLLHAATGFGGFDPRRKLALHGFKDSSVNNWFLELGFEAKSRAAIEDVEIGSYKLPQTLYVSEQGLTIGGLRQRLEDRHPSLAKATFLA